jgi:hypothetical protein
VHTDSATLLAHLTDALPVVLLLFGCTALYLAWFYPLRQSALERRTQDHTPATRMRAFSISKYAGAAIFGVGGIGLGLALGLSPAELGLALPAPLATLGGALLVGVVFATFAAIGASRPPTMHEYPECGATRFDRPTAARSAAAWITYLLGYELLFRGVLLGGLLVLLGDPVVALAIMTALYVLAHLNKAGPEATACLLMGPIFGTLTLVTGGIWAAWIAHCLIAIASENAAARARPEVAWWGSGLGRGPSA